MTDSALPADTVDVDLGGRTVPVPRGGWFDRYRMAAPLDEVAADPRVPGVDFFRTLPKTVVQSPIGETRTPNFYYAMSSARLTMVAPTRAIRRHVPDDLVLFRYDVCDIDFYTEAAVGIAVRPARHGGAGVADLAAALGNDHLHAYVLSLPVNTRDRAGARARRLRLSQVGHRPRRRHRRGPNLGADCQRGRWD